MRKIRIMQRRRNILLQKLSDEQKQTPQYLENVKLVADRIFASLQHTPGIGVDSIRYAGSIAKRTIPMVNFYPDLDLLIFINGESPPFSSELLMACELAVKRSFPGNILGFQRVQYSFRFKVSVQSSGGTWCVLIVDLMLIANLSGTSGSILARQVNTSWKWQYMWTASAESSKVFANCLDEPSVFLLDVPEPESITRVMVIAKYWDHHINHGSANISGRLYIIELVVIYANLMNTNGDLDNMFRRFLLQMRELNVARIIFPAKAKYRESYLPPSKGPCIMDPRSPFNNLGEQFSSPELSGVLTRWRRCAGITLQKLGTCCRDLDDLFSGLNQC